MQFKPSIRKYLTLFFILFSLICHSQKPQDVFQEILDKTKSKSKIDPQDKAALNLINAFYDDALQSDKGELQPKTIATLKNFMGSPKSKNKHLIDLFLLYQQVIDNAVERGLKPNAELQLLLVNALEDEFETIYKLTPAIIYIYKYEALNSDKKSDEANAVVEKGLQHFPDSVPLQVYRYLNSKDAALKEGLIQDHSNHWLVVQKNIK